jgi:hypothetical protein
MVTDRRYVIAAWRREHQMSLLATPAFNLATRSYVEYLLNERTKRYADIIMFRNYADGDHTDFLTDAMRKLLVGTNDAGDANPAPEVRINVCETVIDAEADRLQIKGFTVSTPDNEALSGELSARAWSIWERSRMDEGQQNTHFCAIRDGDSHVIAWYDTEIDGARLTFNRQYDGDTSGIDMLYQDDDLNRPVAAVKVWEVQRPVKNNGSSGRTQRKNVYYENRVEKYININATGTFAGIGWRPLTEGDPDWTGREQPITVTDAYGNNYPAAVEWLTHDGTITGDPLGNPVSHFRHLSKGEALGRSALKPIAPGVQDAINMSGLSLLTAEQLSGFKVTYATNFDPNVNEITIEPGGIVYNSETGSFGQLNETNLVQLQDTLNTWIKLAATLTKTPLTFFNQTGQIPAEGTQRQLEIGLLAKTRGNHAAFGNAWENAIRQALKFEAVYGDLDLTIDVINTLEINAEWEPGDVRNERDDTELALLRSEKAGIPQEQTWKELGYSPDEIAAFKAAEDVKRRAIMADLTQRLAENDAAADTATIAGAVSEGVSNATLNA